MYWLWNLFCPAVFISALAYVLFSPSKGRCSNIRVYFDASEISALGDWIPLMAYLWQHQAQVFLYTDHVTPFAPGSELPNPEHGRFDPDAPVKHALAMRREPRKTFVVTSGSKGLPRNTPGISNDFWHFILTKPYTEHQLYDLIHFGDGLAFHHDQLSTLQKDYQGTAKWMVSK